MAPLARNCGPLAPCSSRIGACDAAKAASLRAAHGREPQGRRVGRGRNKLEGRIAPSAASASLCGSRPTRPSVFSGRSSSSGAEPPSLTKTATTITTRETSTRARSSSRSIRTAAKRGGGGDGEENENISKSRGGGGLLSRWSQLTAREKSVLAIFVALVILFGPRLLLLSLVSLEAAATGALLAAERALGAAFLTSFSWLAGVAALILAGLFVYFLVLEEERLEDEE